MRVARDFSPWKRPSNQSIFFSVFLLPPGGRTNWQGNAPPALRAEERKGVVWGSAARDSKSLATSARPPGKGGICGGTLTGRDKSAKPW